MLQPMTTDRVERFYKDVGTLRLKFPVAEIARATGQSKGNVSKYLSQTLEPSNAFLDRFYRAYSDSFKKVGTTKPQDAQNGPNSNPPLPLTRIAEVIKTIQYKTNPTLTIEAIADKAGVSRQTLQAYIKEGDSQKVYEKLKTEFKDLLTDMTTSTKAPAFEMKPNGNDKDSTIYKQADTINKHADTLKSQQELIAELAKNVMHLSGKLIEKR